MYTLVRRITTGFTLENNRNDALMIVCPTPDSVEGEAKAKLELLLSQGLQPQLFLTAASLESGDRSVFAVSF